MLIDVATTGRARKIASTPQSSLESNIDSAKNCSILSVFLEGESSSVTSGRRRRIAGVVPLPPVSAQLAIRHTSKNSLMIAHLLVGENSAPFLNLT